MEVTMPKSADQILRQISDNSKLIHEYELQLSGYEGRKCASPRKTTDAILRLKNQNKDLRHDLDAVRESLRERKFLKTR
jgi:hypothetical protein